MTSGTGDSSDPPGGEDEYRRQRLRLEKARKVGAIREELLRKAGMIETAEKLQMCLSDARLWPYQGCIKVIRLHPCGLRFICPLCHSSWSFEFARKHLPRLRQLVSEGYKLYFLTLTVVSILNLTRAALDEVWDYWAKLRHQKLFKGCVGTLAVMEFKKGASGWHVQLHITLITDSMIKQEAIRLAWYSLSGGYIIDIKPIRVSTLRDFITYPLKDPNINHAEDLRMLHEATRNYRLVRATGQARRKNGSKSERKD